MKAKPQGTPTKGEGKHVPADVCLWGHLWNFVAKSLHLFFLIEPLNIISCPKAHNWQPRGVLSAVYATG